MPKHFNVAGPCRDEDHYMVPPESRLTEIRPLIEEKAYFVVHAPRQTGKTTSLAALAKSLAAEGKYAAVLTSCKVGEAAGRDVDLGVRSVIHLLEVEARIQLSEALRPPPANDFDEVPATVRLGKYLGAWCERCPRPVVFFLDEVDALVDETLLSVLDQLHAGYRSRPEHFPHSVALIGLRDVRDYDVQDYDVRHDGRGGAHLRRDDHSGAHLRPDGRPRLGSSSPFNIKTESLLMPNFTAEEVTALYAQHTAETGQTFSADALEMAFNLTRGQPWLVNALARQVVMRAVPDRAMPIEVRHLEAAKEALILRRDTHLDSLVKRLREERVRRIVEPILAGESLMADSLNDDFAFVRDLGLVIPGPQGLEIANPIYREIVPRALTYMMDCSTRRK